MKISLTYITNFKPNYLISPDFNFKIDDKKNFIFCKNFLIFLIMWSSLNKISKQPITITFFVKPKQTNLITLLRAPYRHKLSRHQITLSRFFIRISLLINVKKNIFFKKTNQIIVFFKIIENYCSFFETNICYLHRCDINLQCYFPHNFTLMNYN